MGSLRELHLRWPSVFGLLRSPFVRKGVDQKPLIWEDERTPWEWVLEENLYFNIWVDIYWVALLQGTTSDTIMMTFCDACISFNKYAVYGCQNEKKYIKKISILLVRICQRWMKFLYNFRQCFIGLWLAMNAEVERLLSKYCLDDIILGIHEINWNYHVSKAIQHKYRLSSSFRHCISL